MQPGGLHTERRSVSDHNEVGDAQVRLNREQVAAASDGAQTASSGAHNLLKQCMVRVERTRVLTC